MNPFKYIVSAALLLLSVQAFANNAYETIFWETLIPEGATQPEEYSLEDLHRLDELIAEEEKLGDIIGREVVQSLAGKKIKIPAYVVPLELDAESNTEFLLVPYFGACIHVPPPPPNQIIFGSNKQGIKTELIDAIWAYGTLQIEKINTELAESGYSMTVDKIELVDWEEFEKEYAERFEVEQ